MVSAGLIEMMIGILRRVMGAFDTRRGQNWNALRLCYAQHIKSGITETNAEAEGFGLLDRPVFDMLMKMAITNPTRPNDRSYLDLDWLATHQNALIPYYLLKLLGSLAIYEPYRQKILRCGGFEVARAYTLTCMTTLESYTGLRFLSNLKPNPELISEISGYSRLS